jgi:thymidylate kinase
MSMTRQNILEPLSPMIAAIIGLQDSNIEYCLLRDDPTMLPEVTELDLLIVKKDMSQVDKILRLSGWAIFDRGLFTPHKRAYLKFEDRTFLKLDIHLSIIDGPDIYMNTQEVLDRAVVSEFGVKVLSKSDFLFHVIFHTILGKDKLAKKYVQRLTDLLLHEDIVDVCANQAASLNLYSVFCQISDDPIALLTDPVNVSRLQKETRRCLAFTQGNFPRRMRYFLTWSIGQVLGFRKGFAIAVIGPDGAGKTSFNKALRAALRSMEVPVRDAYMGPWEYPILPTTKFLNYLGATPRDEIKGAVGDDTNGGSKSKLIKGLIKRYMYYTNIYFEMMARYFILVFLQTRLRRVVLCDRYIQDLLIGNSNQEVINSLWIRRMICRAFPQPKIIVCLDGDEEVIWSRKKEYSLSIISQALTRYRKVSGELGFEVIKSDVSTEQMVDAFLDRHGQDFIKWRREGRFRD